MTRPSPRFQRGTDPKVAVWIQEVALDAQESSALRERAVRLLAERGMVTANLIQLYDRADDRVVCTRLIRILAERGDRAALEKLTAIMDNDPDTGLRREAQRRLGERAGRD
ncbi:MAG: HEAT repeat domain-containing protein [Gemmatimonadales bacterium]